MDPKKIGAAVTLACAIAIPAEGMYHYSYVDPPGIPTVCFGTTSNVIKNRYYSTEECYALLGRDMTAAIKQVDRCVPNLPINVLAAFGDAVYNIGPSVACNSTANKFLKDGNYIAACNELPRWNKSKILGRYVALPGLTKRREAERKLCLSS